MFALLAHVSSPLRDQGDAEVQHGAWTTTTPESATSSLGRITNRLRPPPSGYTYVVFVAETPFDLGFHPVGAFSQRESAHKSVAVSEPWKLSEDEFGPRCWVSRVDAAEPRWAGLPVKIYEMAVDAPLRTL